MRISGEHGISDDYSIMRVKRANGGEMKSFSLEHGRDLPPQRIPLIELELPVF